MVAIMGTSTCHVMNGAVLAEVPGMCGVVDGGIVAGSLGYEAGQSGGRRHLRLVRRARGAARLSRRGPAPRGHACTSCCRPRPAPQPAGAHGLIALDWLNGNRSVLVDHHLSGVIVGLTLATRAPEIYRALLESTAFGTRVIIDAFAGAGVPGDRTGDRRRPDAQRPADADLRRRHRPAAEPGRFRLRRPALGSAIHAAVAAGCYPDVPAAAAVHGPPQRRNAFTPDPVSAAVYDELYAEYVRLHDYFGRGANEVLHRLRAAGQCADRDPAAAGPTPPGHRRRRS